jgi:hypothetical protein
MELARRRRRCARGWTCPEDGDIPTWRAAQPRDSATGAMTFLLSRSGLSGMCCCSTAVCTISLERKGCRSRSSS